MTQQGGARPDEQTVRGYFSALSNWGRWGGNDQLGAANLITAEKRIEAAGLVRSGRSVSCARPMLRTNSLSRPGDFLHLMIETGEAWDSPHKQTASRRAMAKDFIAMDVHGLSTTHIDSIGHFFEAGRVYNGIPAEFLSANRGATFGAADALKDGIVTRGVLLDVAAGRGVAHMRGGEAIHPDDLMAAEREAGLTVGPGDALFVRTGFPIALAAGDDPLRSGAPGLHASCLPWLHERGVAVLATDSWTDVEPSGYELDMPVHRVAEVAMGLRCIDSADFEALAAMCKDEGRWAFMVVIAPLRLEGATGSPVNPIAVF